jgi:hypothetical protein
VHLHCVVDGALESKVATTMLMLGLVRKSTSLDNAARCTCTSRTPRPALTAPRHDVTAALSGLAAQKHEQGFGASFDANRLHARRRDGAHIEDATWCGYRYTLPLYTPRCVVYSTTHRCVGWPCFTGAKSVPPSRDCILKKIGRVQERGRERTCRRKSLINTLPNTLINTQVRYA